MTKVKVNSESTWKPDNIENAAELRRNRATLRVILLQIYLRFYIFLRLFPLRLTRPHHDLFVVFSDISYRSSLLFRLYLAKYIYKL